MLPRTRPRARSLTTSSLRSPMATSLWVFYAPMAPRCARCRAAIRRRRPLLKQVHDRLSDTHKAVNELRAIRRRAEDWAARAKDKPELETVEKAARAVVERLKPIEAELIQAQAKSRGDELNFPIRLNGKLAYLKGTIASADGPPTASARAVFEDLSARVQTQLDQLAEAVATEVAFLNQAI